MKTYIAKSELGGRGVFAREIIEKDELIELCDLILFDLEETKHIDKTTLYDYYFKWDENNNALILGDGSIYNHSYNPNAIYLRDIPNTKMRFIALRDINPGEEICTNYNGDPKSQKKLWFETKK